jgi:aminopeptidase-like protein
MYEFIRALYPICRSITGEGVRQTLKMIGDRIPLTVYEVPTGTQVLDWVVPREWNIRDAYIADGAGRRIVDFRESNLHVVNYSVPVRARMPLAELRPHLFSLPDHPDWIPYRTSYYVESWGFCLEHRRLTDLTDAEYEVVIDATLDDGSLSYGECLLPGEADDEILISTHVCHPSMCNDNLSGIAVATALAGRLLGMRRRYTYRFLFIPGTIGSVTWLSRNEARVPRIKHGLVAACLGDGGGFTYKKSRRGDAEIDRAVPLALRDMGAPFRVVDFSPYGYDERQYCSPGYDLAVGALSRTQHGKFPEYHTSADNLEFVGPAHLAESLSAYLAVMRVLEGNRRYLNRNPKGEPQLGRRGLYRAIGGTSEPRQVELALLWVLNQSDGRHSLIEIAEGSGLAFEAVRTAADLLVQHDLLEDIAPSH